MPLSLLVVACVATASPLLPDCGDDDPRPWFPDLDGDGWGRGRPVMACAAPDGWANRGSDCDDADLTAFPGAPEVCFDGRDQDCDGVPDDCLVPLEPWWTGSAPGTRLGHALSASHGEVAVGGPGSGDASPNGVPGQAVRLEGGVARLVVEDRDGGWGGYAVLLEDLAGDGAPTLWVGAPAQGPGRVGGVAGFGVDATGRLGWADADASAAGSELGGGLGASLAAWGDGVRSWLVAGAPFAAQEASAGPGAVVAVGVGWRWPGVQAGEGFGTAVVTGDVDADGVAELIVGAPFAEGGGRVDVLPGLEVGSAAPEPHRLAGAAAGSAVGAAVAVDDVDGDGTGDLVVGAPYAPVNGRRRGAVWLVRGPILASAHLGPDRAGGASTDAGAGTSVAVVHGPGGTWVLAGSPFVGGGAVLAAWPWEGVERLGSAWAWQGEGRAGASLAVEGTGAEAGVVRVGAPLWADQAGAVLLPVPW